MIVINFEQEEMMKGRIISVVSILTIIVMMALPSVSFAQAYTTSFSTSITYQNIGTGPASITINFYSEGNATPTPITLDPLPQNAGTSVAVGSLSQLTSVFKGSAVLSSDQPLAATLVQVPQGTGNVKNRPLSNGFTTGSPQMLIATVLKNKFDSNSIISIQNVDTAGADLSVVFINADNPAQTWTDTVTNLPSGAAKYYDLGSISSIGGTTLPTSFNGSVKVSAKQTGTSNSGAIVASVMELNITARGASAFEGVATGSNTVYMPSAMCLFGGVQSSAYAVQNTDASNVASVTVAYNNGNTETADIQPGAKHSFPGCNAGNSAGYIGSSTITSTGGQIVAIGKITGGGLSTAFVGASAGSAKLALPYVRWTTANWTNGTRQRTYIAIQNIGTTPVAAGNVTITYLDKTGAITGIDTIINAIDPGAKTNSNPSNVGSAAAEFGYVGGYGGSAIVQSSNASDKLVVIARVESYVPTTTETVAEDYNGIVAP
jgi:hypothetical protein